MVQNAFESLLSELARSLDIKELRPDSNNSCLIHFQNGTEVQIEPFARGEDLLLVIDLGVVAKGRYREEVFREALKANGLPWPRHGVFCHSDQSDHLLLYKLMPLKDLNGERIASFMGPFLEKGTKWKEHLERGEVPVVDAPGVASGGRGVFGLK